MKPNDLLAKGLASLNFPFMRPLFVCIFLMLGISASASAIGSQVTEKYCISISVKDDSYAEARKKIMNLSEVVNWRNILERNRKQFVVNPKLDKTVFYNGMCFWEITLYEYAGDHLVLWNTYKSSMKGGLVYRINIVDPSELILVK
jgi:hypothetical protein